MTAARGQVLELALVLTNSEWITSVLCSAIRKKEIVTLARKWTVLEITMSSERSWLEKDFAEFAGKEKHSSQEHARLPDTRHPSL